MFKNRDKECLFLCMQLLVIHKDIDKDKGGVDDIVDKIKDKLGLKPPPNFIISVAGADVDLKGDDELNETVKRGLMNAASLRRKESSAPNAGQSS